MNIVILTGAGISAESGLATFRGSDGLWNGHPVMEVASAEGFRKNPALVQNFYNQRRAQLKDPSIQPNAAHMAIAGFQKKHPGNLFLVTQNVDNLHERGDSPEVVHMHGELAKARCRHCESIFEWEEDLSSATPCPGCQKTGGMRPHIVWFGEMPLFMDLIMEKLESCDLFLSIGTSGVVYPAAGFVSAAKATGARTVQINLENTGGPFDEFLIGKATERVPEFLGNLSPNRR